LLLGFLLVETDGGEIIVVSTGSGGTGTGDESKTSYITIKYNFRIIDTF